MSIQVSSDLSYRVDAGGAAPLVFLPLVDFAKVKDPSIIDVF